MGDPLFNNGLNLAVWIILVVKTLAVFVLVLVSVIFMVMYERKAVAVLGVRYGPNRAGPNGWFQSVADGTKLLFKESFTPRTADRAVYKMAPYLMLVPALLVFSIVPLGGTITVAHHTTRLQLVDPPWGILFMLMCSGVAVYGVFLAGWASGSKYPLLGSVRATAQMVSYEAVLGLTTATVVVVSHSLSTADIVAAQHGGFLYHWNFLRTAIVPFALFAIAITAEMTRPPFDLVEAEEELSGGYMLEYASTGFMWFYLAEYAALVTNSAIMTTLWFGGPDGPRIAHHSIGPAWFAIKVLIILYIYVWIRATLPRLRYDQLMELGWKRLIPASLAMLLIVAAFQINSAPANSHGFTRLIDSRQWGLLALAIAVFLGVLLWRAIDVGREATNIEATRDEQDRRLEGSAQ